MKRVSVKCLLILLSGLAIAAVFLTRSLLGQSHLSEALQAIKDRDLDRALTSLKAAERQTPNNAAVHFYLARVYRRQGQLDHFRESLTTAQQLGFDPERIRRENWLAMAQSGQMSQASRHLTELLTDPRDDGAEICEAFANGFFMSYRFDEAFLMLDAWEKDFPDDPQPHLFRAKFATSQAHASATAVDHLKKALALAPGRTDIRLELANTLLSLRKTDEAANHFAQLLKAHPENLDVQIGWSHVLMEKGEADRSRDVLNNVLRQQPDKVEAMLALSQLELFANRPDEAVKLLEKALSLKSYNIEVRYALANALQRVGRKDDAQAHFEYISKATDANTRIRTLVNQVRSNNDDVEARFEIAELLREYGDPRDRVIWLHSIVELDPQHSRALAALADYYESVNEPELAARHRKRAAEAISKPNLQ